MNRGIRQFFVTYDLTLKKNSENYCHRNNNKGTYKRFTKIWFLQGRLHPVNGHITSPDSWVKRIVTLL